MVADDQRRQVQVEEAEQDSRTFLFLSPMAWQQECRFPAAGHERQVLEESAGFAFHLGDYKQKCKNLTQVFESSLKFLYQLVSQRNLTQILLSYISLVYLHLKLQYAERQPCPVR